MGRNRTIFGTPGAQKTLVIVQSALSLVLLIAAALLGESLRNMEHRNYGFDTSGRYLVSIDPKISNYTQQQLVPVFNEVESHLRAIPGVRAVGSGTGMRRRRVGFGGTISASKVNPMTMAHRAGVV